MRKNNRRDFLKSAALAGASALIAPSLLAKESDKTGFLSPEQMPEEWMGDDRLIVPKKNGLNITGTFLDEISHDIPHQNWGEGEWDRDFRPRRGESGNSG